VLLQAAVLVGLAVGFSADLVRGRTQLAGATLFLVVFTLALAAALVLAARALWRGRRWGRAPVLTWQLLLVVMAVGWIRAEPTVWAAAILASAVVVIVTLLLPRVVSVTTGRAPGA
jgi:hypothetical protein